MLIQILREEVRAVEKEKASGFMFELESFSMVKTGGFFIFNPVAFHVLRSKHGDLAKGPHWESLKQILEAGNTTRKCCGQ